MGAGWELGPPGGTRGHSQAGKRVVRGVDAADHPPGTDANRGQCCRGEQQLEEEGRSRPSLPPAFQRRRRVAGALQRRSNRHGRAGGKSGWHRLREGQHHTSPPSRRGTRTTQSANLPALRTCCSAGAMSCALSGEARTLRCLPQHWVHSHRLKKMKPSTLRMPKTRPGTMVGMMPWAARRGGGGGVWWSAVAARQRCAQGGEQQAVQGEGSASRHHSGTAAAAGPASKLALSTAVAGPRCAGQPLNRQHCQHQCCAAAPPSTQSHHKV